MGSVERVVIPAAAITEVVWGHSREATSGGPSRELLGWLLRFFHRPEIRVVPFGRAAALGAGRVRAAAPIPARRLRRDRRSKPERRVAWGFDIQIAATAWAVGLPLATENVADYERIAEFLAELFPGATQLEVQPSPL